MKKILYLSLAIGAAVLSGVSGCKKALDIEPTNKLEVEDVFSNPAGVKLYIANLYWQMPVEDFTYFNNADGSGFNQNGPGPNNGGQNRAMSTDEAVHSENGGISLPARWWAEGYSLIRDVNILIEAIPKLDIQEVERDKLIGEASFIRAWAYYGLAMRYGGVPLIKTTQEWTGDVEALKVQRSTEKATYDFILSELDVAAAKLPASWSGERRATKWVAYALKSRAALYAASLSKYWNKAPLGGVAVDSKYVGMSPADANGYYDASIKASEAIMNSGLFSLYQPTPATPAEAAENYRKLFLDPNVAGNEVMFIKGFALPLDRRGHNYDIWFNPNQLANSWPHPGRMNPTLDLVDSYEDYTDPGKDKPLVTTADGSVTDYSGYSAAKTYLQFADPTEIFKNKDARMHATVVIPFSTMKGTKIVIQAGYVEPGGAARIRTGGSIDVNGIKYYNYGGATTNDYSGFDAFGGNMTKTGFSFRKFIQDAPVINGWNKSTQDWAEFRYAEILLNYAEAVAESGLGDPAKAAVAMNATRRRAAFMTPIPLTIQNVMRERKVEMAFENKRWWDLIRRREYHEMFNAQVTHALLPLLDLRQSPPSYIFIRANAPGISPRTFQIKDYYLQIPDVGASGVIQNPAG